MPPEAQSVFDLSPAEKLQLVQDLWDDLASDPVAVPVPQWHIDELERRRARLASNPGTGLNWEDVKRRLRVRYGR
jgi:putative addiction module component (TIGR02574 family)